MIFCLIISICYLFGFNHTNIETKKYDFSQFTTNDAMNFIVEEKVHIPEGFEEIEGHEEVVLNIIFNAYKTKDYIIPYSSTPMYEFTTDIIEKVLFYIEE